MNPSSKSAPNSLWTRLANSPCKPARFLWAATETAVLSDLRRGTCLDGDLEGLRGRTALIAAADSLAAALALIELDGVARRLVLCPPDLPLEHLPYILSSVPVDAIVSDRTELGARSFAGERFVRCGPCMAPALCDRTPSHQTEWILLTSGTTGPPKFVVHTLSTLAGGIDLDDSLAGGFIWSTFYDIRRYGGLQVFLRAILTGGSLVLSSAHELASDFLTRAGQLGVTHISGTPSHWRKALMSPAIHQIAPQYVRLSGEVADQGTLDNLRSVYPQANIAHAFASTEAGLAFDVRDGRAGFPASFIGRIGADVEMKIIDDSLRVRSSRTALRYIGSPPKQLADSEGFVDTGDIVERRGDRYYFAGRRDGVINVGGLKVHPEEVESVINRHPRVRMSLVRTRKSPITGALVVADIVLKTPADSDKPGLEQEILQFCRETLPRHKVPAAISFRNDLPVSATGKLVRSRA